MILQYSSKTNNIFVFPPEAILSLVYVCPIYIPVVGNTPYGTRNPSYVKPDTYGPSIIDYKIAYALGIIFGATARSLRGIRHAVICLST